jgi:hypothetical protein
MQTVVARSFSYLSFQRCLFRSSSKQAHREIKQQQQHSTILLFFYLNFDTKTTPLVVPI